MKNALASPQTTCRCPLHGSPGRSKSAMITSTGLFEIVQCLPRASHADDPGAEGFEQRPLADIGYQGCRLPRESVLGLERYLRMLLRSQAIPPRPTVPRLAQLPRKRESETKLCRRRPRRRATTRPQPGTERPSPRPALPPSPPAPRAKSRGKGLSLSGHELVDPQRLIARLHVDTANALGTAVLYTVDVRRPLVD
jgi:hypothetical protein